MEFEVKLYSDLKQDLSVILSDGSKIMLHTSDGVANSGKMIFEIDQPNYQTASSEGKTKIRNFLRVLLIVKNLKTYREFSITNLHWLNSEDFPGVLTKISASV